AVAYHRQDFADLAVAGRGFQAPQLVVFQVVEVITLTRRGRDAIALHRDDDEVEVRLRVVGCEPTAAQKIRVVPARSGKKQSQDETRDREEKRGTPCRLSQPVIRQHYGPRALRMNTACERIASETQ